MMVMYVIYLLVTLLSIEVLIVQKEYSKEQRLLPLTLGLICLYEFYLIVERYTGATEIFSVLKYLLLLQFLYLMFYYILDFCSISLPLFANIISFSVLGIADIMVVVFMGYDELFRIIIMGVSIAVILCGIGTATSVIIRRSRISHIHNMYKMLYAALFFPFVAMVLIFVGVAEERVVLPSSLMVFVVVVLYLMLSGQFFETHKYVMEDLFKNTDDILFIFDRDLCFIEATNAARTRFPEFVSSMEKNRMEYPQRTRLLKWIEKNQKNFKYAYEGSFFRIVITDVKRKNKLNGYIVTVTDITLEMSEIESAQEQTRLKSEFLANMSHELRSPLNAIIGGSEWVLLNNEITVKNRVMISNIKAAGNSLLEIVNSILEYSKIEAGKIKINREEYDIRGVLRNQFQGATVLLENSPVDFRIISTEPIPATLIGDKNRIQTIIQNLLTNSIKYTKKGQIECRIGAESQNKDTCILSIEVQDTGIGMTKEQTENAFKKYTTYGSEVSESTGIGLYVVKELCELMGGSIAVNSEPGVGTTFTIRIKQKIGGEEYHEPFCLDKNKINEINIEKVSSFTPEWIYPDANILVVDDMKVNREVVKGKASSFAINVYDVESGKLALEALKKDNYDLVILDQMMPEMDGFETADEIRKFSDIPVVMLTANVSDNMIKQCEIHKINGYLAKPLSIEQFENVLIKWIPENYRKQALVSAGLSNQSQQLSHDDPMFIPVIEAFKEDIEEIVLNLKDDFENNLDGFRVKVHGIKGTARQIGHFNIADEAECMEMAAKAEHRDYIARHLEGFIKDLMIEVSDAKSAIETGK